MGDMKILTVCLGNICRSPAAESVLNREFTQAGIDATVASAGTADYHVGNEPHELTRQVGHERGYDFPSVADQVSPRHIDQSAQRLATGQNNAHRRISFPFATLWTYLHARPLHNGRYPY